MESISRFDLDLICKILAKDVGTKQSKNLAKILGDVDIIPKLYAYTYFKKVLDVLNDLKVHGNSLNMDDICEYNNENPKLQLDIFSNVTEIKKLVTFLRNGFDREKQFCDFNDSKFHDQTKIGRCQEENHYEVVDQPLIPLTNEEQKEFDRIAEQHGLYIAQTTFVDNFNPDNQKLTPTFYCDEETQKFKDDPVWVCEACSDSLSEDCDCMVSCDMDDPF